MSTLRTSHSISGIKGLSHMLLQNSNEEIDKGI